MNSHCYGQTAAELSAGRGGFIQNQSLVGFRCDLIDHRSVVLSAFSNRQLAIRAAVLAQDGSNVRHLALAAELFDFGRDEFQNFFDQTARIQLAAAAKIDQFATKGRTGLRANDSLRADACRSQT